MIALLRYAFLKSWRDKSLPAFILFSGGSFLVMRLAVAAVEMLRGHPIVDESFDRDFVPVAAASATMMAALAGFWTLRLEIGDRSIGSFIVASRSAAVAEAITIYASIVGLTSFVLTLPMSGITPPPELGTFGNVVMLTVCSVVVGGAFGIAMATVSPEPPMVVPTWIGASFVIAAAFELIEPAVIAGAIVLTALLLVTTSLLLERRCVA